MRMPLRLLAVLFCCLWTGLAQAQIAQEILQSNSALVEKASRTSIGPVIDALAASGDPSAAVILGAWAEKGLGLRKSDGRFVLIAAQGDAYALRDLQGNDLGSAPRSDITELCPNAGVRGLIATALVQFNLSDPDRAKRAAALDSIATDPAEAGLAPARLTLKAQRAALLANMENGAVGGMPVAELNTQAARDRVYTALEGAGNVPVATTEDEVATVLAQHQFLEIYQEADPAVTTAAQAALSAISQQVGLMQAADLALDGLSLASIYFLAAIGLAITFGGMGVINMAHGECITIGAYTGFVVQQWVPNYTASIVVALPLAFAVTFALGVAMERLVIRHLYKRPLETLLATFGISIALQQILKNVFGTQARPLTSPAWLDGAWVLKDVVSISYIRIAIFGLALLFLGVFLWLMTRTRLGLKVRAVTQNPTMAASMGINPDRINILTFGIGSGIAGIAGVAIGLFAKVTSELGTDYIVQSFMTVVVGGVGNIWGALAGATMIGGLQKAIEWLNPSNTLAAQTYMILFIILFLQVRPGASSPSRAARQEIDMTDTRKSPSLFVFLAVLLGSILLMTLLSEGYGSGHLSTSFIKTLGLCLAALAMDLIWGFAHSFPLQMALVVLVPGLLALVFGFCWSMNRRRV